MQVLDLYIYCLFRVFTRRIFRYLILYVNPPILIMTKFFYCGVGCSYLTFDFLFKTDPRFFLIFIFRNFYFNTSGYRMKCFDLHEAFRSHFKAAFSEWKFSKGSCLSFAELHIVFIFELKFKIYVNFSNNKMWQTSIRVETQPSLQWNAKKLFTDSKFCALSLIFEFII